MAHRAARLAEAIKEELADIFQNELKDPRLGFLTITRVEVSSDLRYAKVFLSVYGSPAECESTLGVLERAQGFIRSQLGRRIRLRHVPEISFRFDPSIDYGVKIARLIDELKKDGASEQPE
ncbi:30S ribosome-binding factor RbfA [Thermodesulfitimonas autotrophica]|jgi:ribosome-binding factor A|uniref:30S ribosome-binding factor RbfA n=1 Tax=Thermodesulfitimonas autotrophica TaxID=1894989 RepID=UPI002FE0DFAC